MTTDVRSCYPDTPVEELLELMQGLQVRRVPVVDGDQRLVGIVSLGDLATDDPRVAAEAAGRHLHPGASGSLNRTDRSPARPLFALLVRRWPLQGVGIAHHLSGQAKRWCRDGGARETCRR